MSTVPEGDAAPGRYHEERVTTNSHRLKTLQKWSPPEDKYEFSSIFGPYTYYWRFTAGFAGISMQLTYLMDEKRTFQWSPEAEVVFRSLKYT
jgi:hypothetical protein